jgi:hypothetical protein
MNFKYPMFFNGKECNINAIVLFCIKKVPENLNLVIKEKKKSYQPSVLLIPALLTID